MSSAPRPLGETVLEMLLAGDDPVLAALRAQTAVARVVRRERTKVGFFEIFEVPQGSPRLDSLADFVLDDVAAELEGVEGVARFLLSICDGSLDFLEGAMLGSRWPASPRIHRLYYLRPSTSGGNVIVETGSRDLAALRARWSS